LQDRHQVRPFQISFYSAFQTPIGYS
jgi:hypothetical protein